MYRYQASDAMLNSRIMEAIHPNARFVIYYWGADERLHSNPIHKHSFFEACYVLGGTGTYTDNGRTYALKSGTLFLSRPGATHQILTEDGLSLLFVAFEPDEARTDPDTLSAFRALADAERVCVEDGSRTPTALLWESLLLRDEERHNLPESAVAPAASALLLSFLGLFGEQSSSLKAGMPRDNMVLRRAKLYIRDNLSKPLPLPEMAAMLNVSERHLSRLFSGGIHESFTGYIRRERVREAARLLNESELPIKEIAEMAGFSSVHYFSRTFASMMHAPPGVFRRRARSASSAHAE
ncbi:MULTISPECIES: AraC family transcriptional regulator [unclassified Paenibacillus]|uniref:helix-turn-helix domain-containing protein n=1 Tax=unclassified Paenibacillus TaxID=185978 RepID=UPI000954C278|nr:MULTISPECIES: AraC family transcriptional regulator [unclassified Paenibacillus]ASS65396.1 AraC family transcriptional regulator [Paenibacillus sp. RUD330]SIQ37620.1 AraC family transcriptional regulator, L-rhamnose operon transcriptional activator RhaR [Paenibacillus sp. RU4X]SIQ59752.1 AraC family transcriptional regulator, L-rhamnose operon transcriptional activator RhaR [Paenibacillus sp. RU4T]